MLTAIHAVPRSSHSSISLVELTTATTVKLSDASNRVINSRLRVDRSLSTTTIGTSLTSVVAA
jgi:hypothetical protein